MPRLAPAVLSGTIATLTMLSTVNPLYAGQESDGRDKPVISAIGERLRPFVEDREIAGAVTLSPRPTGSSTWTRPARPTSPADKPMRPDTIFWIASMTKPITATAVLMLQDEGKLSVDDPVEKYLPEFRPEDGRRQAGAGHDPPPAHAHLGHGRDHARRGPRRSRPWPG